MRIGVVLATFFFGFALPLRAQEEKKSFEVSPFFGYLYGGTVSDFRFDVPIGFPVSEVRFDLADMQLTVSGSVTTLDLTWSRKFSGLIPRHSFEAPGRCQFPICVSTVVA